MLEERKVFSSNARVDAVQALLFVSDQNFMFSTWAYGDLYPHLQSGPTEGWGAAGCASLPGPFTSKGQRGAVGQRTREEPSTLRVKNTKNKTQHTLLE